MMETIILFLIFLLSVLIWLLDKKINKLRKEYEQDYAYLKVVMFEQLNKNYRIAMRNYNSEQSN